MATETQQVATPPNGAPPAAAQVPAAVPKTPATAAPAQEELGLQVEFKKEAPKDAPAVDPKADPAKVEVDPKAEVPKAIELKLPEGFKADDPAIKGLVELATGEKLTTEQTQKLFDRYVEVQKTRDESLVAQYRKERADWLVEAKADPEFGGPKFEASIADGRKALIKYGDQALVEFLNSTNGVNHPAVIRAFARIGRALAEDKATDVKGNPPPPVAGPGAALKAQYPSMFNADGTPK